jgi:hypothetical protein
LACSGEGVCAPGAVTTCGNGGMKMCGADCQWGTTCGGQMCSGSPLQPCGNCGSQIRTCDPNTGNWSSWGACTGGGACAPGAKRGCQNSGTETCDSTCNWGMCVGQVLQCAGSSTQTCECTGSQSRTCDMTTGTWSSWGPCVGGVTPADMQTDPHHCGSCTNDCAKPGGGHLAPGASGTCVNGVCEYVSSECAPGYLACAGPGNFNPGMVSDPCTTKLHSNQACDTSVGCGTACSLCFQNGVGSTTYDYCQCWIPGNQFDPNNENCWPPCTGTCGDGQNGPTSMPSLPALCMGAAPSPSTMPTISDPGVFHCR